MWIPEPSAATMETAALFTVAGLSAVAAAELTGRALGGLVVVLLRRRR